MPYTDSKNWKEQWQIYKTKELHQEVMIHKLEWKKLYLEFQTVALIFERIHLSIIRDVTIKKKQR